MKQLILIFSTSLIINVFAQYPNPDVQTQKSFAEGPLTLSRDVAATANTPSYLAEHYSVWISTTGNQPADFTIMLFEETLSTEIPGWEYQPRSVNIDAYAGMDGNIAFRHHQSTDKYRIVTDNVKISQTDLKNSNEELVILSEDFQLGIDNPLGEAWLPDDWTVVNADGDAFKWYFGVRQEQGAMRSQSWDATAGALTPDNWLITPMDNFGVINNVKTTDVNTIRVYPNPASSHIIVKSDVNLFRTELVNMLGNTVMTADTNVFTTTTDVSTVRQGLYFLRFHTEKGIITRKINISR